MQRTIINIVLGITDHWRERWIEWSLGWLLIAQGTRLQTHDAPNINRLYIVVYSFISPEIIGPIAITIGVVWISALFLNGTFVNFRQISPWVRVGASSCAMVYWTFWSITLEKASQKNGMFSVSWINHGMLAFMALMCLLTLADEVAAVDRRAKACRRQRMIGSR